MDMTYSQIDYYARAARTLEIESKRLDLAIAHNPFSKNAQDAKRLGMQFEDVLARLRGRITAGVPAGGAAGVNLGVVARMLGGAKREVLSTEEMAARRERDTAARLRTQEILARRLKGT